MTHLGIMTELYRFKGKQVIECFNDIQEIARAYGLSVNVMDPEINKINIDNEPDRLNVKTDKDSVITSFTIG
jgi:hypothetical protein